MIEIGKQLVSLKCRFSRHYPWSRFAWWIKYPDKDVIFHALTSDTLVCPSGFQNRVSVGALSTSEIKTLKRRGIILANINTDQELVKRLKSKVGQIKPVTTLFLIVTDNCNLRCEYCYEDLPCYGQKKNMSYETMKRAIDNFFTVCAKDAKIFFYGGEPLLLEGTVKKAIEYIRKNLGNNQVDMQITTNATVYKPDLVDFLKKYRVGTAISLDGPEEINNRMRLAKSKKLNVFAKATAFLKDCQKARLDYSLLCTITEKNADRIVSITNFFLQKLGVNKITFNLKLKQPSQKPINQAIFWHNVAINIAEAYFIMLKYGVVESRTLRYITGLTEGTYSISECDAGYGSQIVVNPDGLIGPCQGFLFDPNFFIKVDDWYDVSCHPLWRKFAKATPINLLACQNCPFIGTCGGGCHYNRVRFDQPNLNFCQYMRSLIYSVIKEIT